MSRSRWFRQAIAAGSTVAMRYLGSLERQRQRLEEAETWCRHAAERGDDLAIRDLDRLVNYSAPEGDRAWKLSPGEGVVYAPGLALIAAFADDWGVTWFGMPDPESKEAWFELREAGAAVEAG